MSKAYLSICILMLVVSCSYNQDQRYKPFSTAIVALTILDNPVDTIYVSAIALPNIPRKASEVGPIEIASGGTYYLSLTVDRPSQSTLSVNDTDFNIITRPNDTTFVFLKKSGRDLDLKFKGRDREINEYLLIKKRTLGYSDLIVPLNLEMTSKMNYGHLLSITDSLVNNELFFLETYLTSAKLPTWFIDYERAEVEYRGGAFKLAIPDLNQSFGLFKDTLPSNYYDFLSGLEIDNENAILSSKYYWFLDEYFRRGLALEEFSQLAGYKRSSKIINYTRSKANGHLSHNVKSIYNQYLFSIMIQKISDASKIDSLAKQFEIQNINDFKGFYSSKVVNDSKINNEKEHDFRNLHTGDQVTEFFVVNKLDSAVSIRDFSDKVVYINFWATWCGPCLKNIPELNKTIEKYSKNSSIAFLNICLSSEKETWHKVVAKTKLKGTNLFAEGAWGKILFSEFNVSGLPSYVLLNKGNKLIEHNTDKAPIVEDRIDGIVK